MSKCESFSRSGYQLVVSTWSDDGHLHATAGEEAAVPIPGRKAADCPGSFGRGSVGATGGAGARSQCKPGLQLVPVVYRGDVTPSDKLVSPSRNLRPVVIIISVQDCASRDIRAAERGSFEEGCELVDSGLMLDIVWRKSQESVA